VRKDARKGFRSGVASLDTWLIEHAPAADAAGSARTYVVLDEEDNIAGYYALTVASSSGRKRPAARREECPPPDPDDVAGATGSRRGDSRARASRRCS
jgi:hypothetical protein